MTQPWPTFRVQLHTGQYGCTDTRGHGPGTNHRNLHLYTSTVNGAWSPYKPARVNTSEQEYRNIDGVVARAPEFKISKIKIISV